MGASFSRRLDVIWLVGGIIVVTVSFAVVDVKISLLTHFILALRFYFSECLVEE